MARKGIGATMKAIGANMDYGMIPTILSHEHAVLIPTVFWDATLCISPTSASYDPRTLQFTPASKDSFNGFKLADTVSDINGWGLDPSSLGPFKVYEVDDARLWYGNNERLGVARQAALPAVDVKIMSGPLREETGVKHSDPVPNLHP